MIYQASTSGWHPAQLPDPSGVFVIHGRQKVQDFNAFLRSMGLQVLEFDHAKQMTGIPTPTVMDVVRMGIASAQTVAVLMTPDDVVSMKRSLLRHPQDQFERCRLAQPRPNVFLEAGIALDYAPERTLLVQIGMQRQISDLKGFHFYRLDNTVASRQQVAMGLRTAGSRVDLSGVDWHTAGDFRISARPSRWWNRD